MSSLTNNDAKMQQTVFKAILYSKECVKTNEVIDFSSDT